MLAGRTRTPYILSVWCLILAPRCPMLPGPATYAGNYDIVNAVKHMRQHKCKFRVVGLSATPGSDAQKVQVRAALRLAKLTGRTSQDGRPALQDSLLSHDACMWNIRGARPALPAGLQRLNSDGMAYMVLPRARNLPVKKHEGAWVRVHTILHSGKILVNKGGS